MGKIFELYVHLSKEELEILMFEYGDMMALKFALSRIIDKQTTILCEKIVMSDRWEQKDSVIEQDEGEAS